MICLPVVARTNAEALRQLAIARAEPADLVELRLDILEEPPALAALLEGAGRPAVATCRSREQGGRFSGTAAERRALLQAALDLGAAYVDAEEDVVNGLRRREGATIIASWHDFSGMPADLNAVAERLAATPCDWVKFAVTPENLRDNFAVLDAVRASRKPAVGIAMGELGLASRVLGPAHGSKFTFGTLSAGLESAPGQPTVRELVHVYRLPRLTAKTAVYGLAGDPVRHSSGHLFHNAGFEAMGVDAVYIPFLCRDLAGFAAAAPEKINLRGLSVTMPLKREALALADEAADVARSVGAANTLTRRGGKWLADNTDFTAVAAGVGEGAKAGGISPRGARALLLGAGGAGRAIGLALASLGCRVTVAARDAGKAERLAAELGWEAAAWNEAAAGEWTVVANSTPIGMSPAVDATPFPASGWRPGMLAFDAVYHPRLTRFLREARAAGAATVDGRDMFLRQAERQFEIWTGLVPPRSAGAGIFAE